MLGAGTVDLDATRSGLQTLLDVADHRFARLDDAVRRAAASHPGMPLLPD